MEKSAEAKNPSKLKKAHISPIPRTTASRARYRMRGARQARRDVVVSSSLPAASKPASFRSRSRALCSQLKSLTADLPRVVCRVSGKQGAHIRAQRLGIPTQQAACVINHHLRLFRGVEHHDGRQVRQIYEVRLMRSVVVGCTAERFIMRRCERARLWRGRARWRRRRDRRRGSATRSGDAHAHLLLGDGLQLEMVHIQSRPVEANVDVRGQRGPSARERVAALFQVGEGWIANSLASAARPHHGPHLLRFLDVLRKLFAPIDFDEFIRKRGERARAKEEERADQPKRSHSRELSDKEILHAAGGFAELRLAATF